MRSITYILGTLWITMQRILNKTSEHIDNALGALIENGPPETSWDSIVPIVEEENMNTLNDGFHMCQADNENNDIPIDDSDRPSIHEGKETRSKLSM